MLFPLDLVTWMKSIASFLFEFFRTFVWRLCERMPRALQLPIHDLFFTDAAGDQLLICPPEEMESRLNEQVPQPFHNGRKERGGVAVNFRATHMRSNSVFHVSDHRKTPRHALPRYLYYDGESAPPSAHKI